MPLAFNLFAHLDADRYAWVTAQSGPCAHMEPAAFMCSTYFTSWLLAFGALGLLLGTRRLGDDLFRRLGIYVGALLAMFTILVALFAPGVAAALLGCF
jgi:hypothetical protein